MDAVEVHYRLKTKNILNCRIKFFAMLKCLFFFCFNMQFIYDMKNENVHEHRFLTRSYMCIFFTSS